MMSSSGASSLSCGQGAVHRVEQRRPPGRLRGARRTSASIRWEGAAAAIAGLASTRVCSASGRSAASRPSASLNGRYGGEPSPKSRQWPTSTRQPSADDAAAELGDQPALAGAGVAAEQTTAAPAVSRPQADELGQGP